MADAAETKMLPVLSPVRSCIGMDGARESNADLGPLRTNNFLPKDFFLKGKFSTFALLFILILFVRMVLVQVLRQFLDNK